MQGRVFLSALKERLPIGGVTGMKVTMVIPTYWGRAEGWREGDAIYDHPTPLNSEGTLRRTIKSMEILNDKDFRLVVLAVATAEDIENRVEKKVSGVVKAAAADAGVDSLVFGPSHLQRIRDLLNSDGKTELAELLSLRGYSSVRNLCLFVPHVLGADVAVFIDDDEVFEDPNFMAKAKEFVGRRVGGTSVDAVAGYYLQPDGDYRIKKPFRPWMKYWDQYERMNEAFDKIIGMPPRLKETPFVFGGNMVVHRNLWKVVPFDPHVPRGEDIDFLINARMFGFRFFLDNELHIKHLPPPKPYPAWLQLRQDIFRFVYERAKIESQKDVEGMTRVRPEDLDPYPGCFLKYDLEEKIEKACRLLAEEYRAQGDQKGAEEALWNITLAKTEAVPKFDPFLRLCELQRQWQELMAYVEKREVRLSMAEVVEA